MHISDIKNTTARRAAIIGIVPFAIVSFTILGLAEATLRAGVAFYAVAKDYVSEVRDTVNGARENWPAK